MDNWEIFEPEICQFLDFPGLRRLLSDNNAIMEADTLPLTHSFPMEQSPQDHSGETEVRSR